MTAPQSPALDRAAIPDTAVVAYLMAYNHARDWRGPMNEPHRHSDCVRAGLAAAVAVLAEVQP